MHPTEPPLLIPIPEVLDGPRVRLRTYQPEDAAALLKAVEESRPDLEPWLRWPRDTGTLDGARQRIVRLRAAWLLRERLEWGVFERESGWLLGGLALINPDWEGRVFEVSYWLRKSAEGRGYMREGLTVVTRLAFENLGANRVVVRVEADNTRSQRVPEGLGYTLEGVLRRDHLGLDGEPTDVLVFALTPEDHWRVAPEDGAAARGGPVSAQLEWAEGECLPDILRFLEAVDGFKSIYRASYLADGSRRESDAEHTWHASLFALLLARQTRLNLRIEHVLELIIVHDLIELYAGDTYAHDATGRQDKRAREEEGARRLFALLPSDIGGTVRAWWEEFEAAQTTEARFALAIDRLQAFAQNVFAGGRVWRERGVTEEMSRGYNARPMALDPALQRVFKALYERASRENLWASAGPVPKDGGPSRIPSAETTGNG